MLCNSSKILESLEEHMGATKMSILLHNQMLCTPMIDQMWVQRISLTLTKKMRKVNTKISQESEWVKIDNILKISQICCHKMTENNNFHFLMNIFGKLLKICSRRSTLWWSPFILDWIHLKMNGRMAWMTSGLKILCYKKTTTVFSRSIWKVEYKSLILKFRNNYERRL